jgi:hypothetical protein
MHKVGTCSRFKVEQKKNSSGKVGKHNIFLDVRWEFQIK